MDSSGAKLPCPREYTALTLKKKDFYCRDLVFNYLGTNLYLQSATKWGRLRVVPIFPRDSRASKNASGRENHLTRERRAFRLLYYPWGKMGTTRTLPLPCPLPLKLGCLLFSIGSLNSGTTLHGGIEEEKLYFSLLKSVKHKKVQFRAKCLNSFCRRL